MTATFSRELLMVTISGVDRTGVLAIFSRILVVHQVEIVDIQQASLHKFLGLYLLVDLKNVAQSAEAIIKDLLFEASRLGLNLEYQFVSAAEVDAHQPSRPYVLTYFGNTHFLAEVSRVLGEERVNIQTVVSRRHHGARSVEMVIDVADTVSLSRFKERVMATSRQFNTDVALQRMEAYRKNKRLIFFDMDSTLVEIEIIDEMARVAGVFREVARITDKAMRGELDFEESLIQRVALLKGLGLKELAAIRDNLKLSDGAEELVKTLKWLGFKTGVVTGGFDYFADYIQEKLRVDYAYANHLDVKNGVLSGRVTGKVLDATEKARIVNQTACDQGIPLDQTVVVGDGANDALMLGQAGLAIAYNAKKGLERVANVALGKTRMAHIFHLLGITETDINEATHCETTP
jgi:phosphoserine phosphatase